MNSLLSIGDLKMHHKRSPIALCIFRTFMTKTYKRKVKNGVSNETNLYSCKFGFCLHCNRPPNPTSDEDAIKLMASRDK